MKCGTPGCEAMKIGTTHSVAADVYYIKCKAMQTCHKCKLMFCEKHDWHWLRKKATHGYYPHEIAASCDTCLPTYIAGGYIECAEDKLIDF